MGFTLDLQPHPASVAAPDAKQADPQVAFTLLGAAIEDARELERHARSLEDRIEVCDSDRPEDFGGSCKEMFIACRRSLGAAGDPKIRTACMHLYGSGSRLPVELPAPDGPHLDDTQIAQLKAGCAANKQSCLAIDTACKTFPAWTAELTQLCEVTRADRERVRDPVSSAGPPVGLVLEGMLGGFSPSGNVGLQYGGSVGLRVEHAWGFGLRQSEGAVLALGARATLGGYQLLGTNGDLQLNFAALYDFESFQLGAVIAVGGDTLGTHVAQLGLPDAGFAGYGLGAFELRAGGPGEHFTFLFGGADRFATSLDRELRGEAIVELRRLAIGARFQRWDDGPTSVTIGTAFGLTVGSIF
jgi:hypothetical protein